MNYLMTTDLVMMKILDNILAIVAQKMCRLYSSGGIEMENKKK